MKFITEADLRDLYKKEPFTAFNLKPGTKLTPGARQFLADIRVNKFDGADNKTKNEKRDEAAEMQVCGNKWEISQLQSRMKSIEALFLLTVEELLGSDPELAQLIVQLKVQFSKINKALKDKHKPIGLICTECNGIYNSNFSDQLDDCIEITEFHMLLGKGREILLLHRLRCAMQEIGPAAQLLYGSSEEENLLLKDITGKVNQVINSTSQLICSMTGGEKCPRKP